MIALLIDRSARRRITGAGAACVVLLACTISGGVVGSSVGASSQDGASVSGFEDFNTQHADEIEVGRSRANQMRKEAYERIVDRLAHDLGFNEDQINLCRLFFEEYNDAYTAASDERIRAMDEWRRQSWFEFVPELHDSADLSHLTLADQIRIGIWRKQVEAGVPPSIDEEKRRALEDAERRASNHLMSEIVRPRRQRALEQLLHDIESVLSESQWQHWERAKRRTRIAMDDAFLPRTGAQSRRYVQMKPYLPIEVLGILDEACAEDGELNVLAPALVSVFSSDRDIDGNQWEFAPVARALERFELAYEIAFETYHKRRDALERFSARGISWNDTRFVTANVSQLRSTAHLWSTRLAFADELRRLAGDLIGEEAAKRWEERFFARCSPILFLPDAVDALANRIEQLNAEDAIPPDARESIERIIAQYCADRHALRVRASRGSINLQGRIGSSYAGLVSELEALYKHWNHLEEHTIRLLHAILAGAGIDLRDQAGDADD